MTITYKDAKCTIIKFDEPQDVLRRKGWLGDEAEARIFRIDPITTEVRIFKTNGESYVLNQDSKDLMVRMKVNALLELDSKTMR